MIVAIHQPQYLPWLGYFDKIQKADVFILLDDVQFKKNEWQNRNRIKTPQGAQWITVPVRHQFGQLINEVALDQKMNWSNNHLKTLTLNYKKAPYFDEFIIHFENIYAQSWQKLVDINVEIIKVLVKILKIETKIVMSSTIQTDNHPTQRLIDLCLHFNADQYLSGPDGPNYMDMAKFQENNLNLIIQKFEHPQYPQLWNQKQSEFISHLSIVDLLFNVGQDALNVLKN
ncbi:MAG: WbqC family protein [Candidatus Omnitrophica bacterium]|nr:WbqC family protein [Candidatus Omnitrophota bacterium]